MLKEFRFTEQNLLLSELSRFTFDRDQFASVMITSPVLERVSKSHHRMLAVMEKGIAIYGVTTGFGDSASRLIPPSQSEYLQSNLVSYLLCGTGPTLPRQASRATLAIRLNSLTRGYSGVSLELIERMRLFLEKDWIPVVPREGSLGASGDLVPLAYLARVLQGEGKIHCGDQIRETRDVLKENGISPYVLKAKEGLALVNGTSSMAGLALVNLSHARNLIHLTEVATAWLTLALGGRTESFGTLINQKAKSHPGQTRAAKNVSALLTVENYQTPKQVTVGEKQQQLSNHVQDRYSLRCMPQIMGPIIETVEMVSAWVETEINGAADNPLFDDDGSLATGGNFYGGHLSQGMDYLKISLANMADMIDRQLMLVIDEKTNRGLTPNLAAWAQLPEDEKFLHHGLKGLHQATSAITAEILQRATPNSIFSRSSESHNQDKVSMGMGAAVQCAEQIEALYTVAAMSLTCLAQALDLRGIQLQGNVSRNTYALIRESIPFVVRDMSLGEQISKLKSKFQNLPKDQI